MKWRQVYLGSSNVGGIGTEYVSAIFTGDGESVGFGAGALIAEDLQRAVEVSLKQGRWLLVVSQEVVNKWMKTGRRPVDMRLPSFCRTMTLIYSRCVILGEALLTV